MKSIRGSLGSSPKSNFFSFQDIIMSVTGILIVIALMLALQIDKVTEQSPHNSKSDKDFVSNDKDPDTSSPEELARLENEIMNKSAQLESIMRSANTEADINQIEHDIQKIENQIARLSKPTKIIEPVVPSNINLDELKKRMVEIQRLKQEIQTHEKNLSLLEKKVANNSRKVILMEEKVKSAESSVLQLRLEKQKLQLIRELSDTTKEPIIVDISQNKIIVMRFDTEDTSEMTSITGLESYVKSCTPENQYFVLYFRPSGVSKFDAIRNMIKSAGFEVGYDATEENTDLSLGKKDQK